MIGRRMKKALMIAYYFPPLSGVAAHRVFKFAKYLPRFGWQPIVLSVKKGVDVATEPSLLKDIPSEIRIYRTSCLDFTKFRYAVYGKMKPQTSQFEEESGTNERRHSIFFVLRWLYHVLEKNVLVPDEKIGWVPFALYRSMQIVRREDIDLIYTTGSPFSAHLLGLALKMLTGRPLVVDFRDPWTGNIFSPSRNRVRETIEATMERRVLWMADRVIATTPVLTRTLRGKSVGCKPEKFITVTNGYDPEDFHEMTGVTDGKFVISHTGSFYGRRTPLHFLQAVRELVTERKELRNVFQIHFFGHFGERNEQYLGEFGLQDIVHLKGHVSHQVSIRNLMQSHVLLLIIHSRGYDNIPGKTFEYIRSGRPILALVPDGVTADVIRNTKTGVVIPPDDIGRVKEWIMRFYEGHKRNRPALQPDQNEIDKYNVERLSEKLSLIFQSCLDEIKIR